MKGKATFSRREIEEIRATLREKQTADSDTQKSLRGRLRKLEFFISDFSDDQAGFTAADFDLLLARGAIGMEES